MGHHLVEPRPPFCFLHFQCRSRPRSQGTPPGFPTVQALGPCHTGAVGQEDLRDVAARMGWMGWMGHEWILDRSGKGVIFVALTTLERTITKLDTDRR